MNRRFFGVFSLLLLFVALGLAVYRLFYVSVLFGTVYTAFVPLAFLLVFYFYCRKCPHVKEGTCRHVLFGWATFRLFKTLEPGPYTRKEILFTLAALMILVLAPQYWLFGAMALFIAFWVLMAAAVVMVLTSVCKGCYNRNCSFCPNRNK